MNDKLGFLSHEKQTFTMKNLLFTLINHLDIIIMHQTESLMKILNLLFISSAVVSYVEASRSSYEEAYRLAEHQIQVERPCLVLQLVAATLD
jgi:hypothetical protein